MKTSLILILALLIFGKINVLAQIEDEQLKVAFTKQFAENINWPNEDKFDKFRIAIVNGSKGALGAFKTLAQTKKIKGKPIEIEEVSELPQKNNFQLVFCSNMAAQDIDQVFKSLKKQNTLLITDRCTDQEIIMINFIESKQNQQTRFEINKSNITFQGLEITPKLLLLGGTEIDVRELYKKSEAASRQLRAKLQEQENELKKQRTEMENTKRELLQQKQELDKQKMELTKQNDEIKRQNALITNQKTKLDELLSNIAQKEALLNQKLAVLKTQEEEIKKKEDLIAQQRSEETKQKEVLKQQQESISTQEGKIRDQKLVLLTQGTTIKVQQNMLAIFIAFFVVIGVLLYFIIKNNRQKQKLNLELESKQADILSKNTLLESQANELKLKSEELMSQAEELSAQADELSVTNDNLKEIQEHTMASIRTAYTIQQAMLPMDVLLNENYAVFTIYSPKDVVSGDFYWYYVEPASDGKAKKTYFAVVDCTGHGVPGAFMSVIGNRTLNSIVAEKRITDPAQMLEALDTEVRKALRQEQTNNNDGMDASICMLEQIGNQKIEVTFAAAKQNLLILRKNETDIRIIKGTRRSVGGARIKKSRLEFMNQTLSLTNEDRIYLYSDGIADQNNKARKSFGNERLMDTILESRNMSLEKQRNHIKNTLETYSENEPQRDDITFVGIKL